MPRVADAAQVEGERGSRVAEAGSVGGPPPILDLTWAFHTPETRQALHDNQVRLPRCSCTGCCARGLCHR